MRDEDNEERVHMIVSGRVQAVGFRYFTWQTARTLQIHGWVRNNDDGTVEISASGSKQNLDAFTREIRKGSPFSRVRGLDVSPEKRTDDYRTFEIIG